MRFNNHPLPLIAVAGGSGKTCAAHLIRHVLEQGTGKRYGLITTRHIYRDGAVLPPLSWPNWREELDHTLDQMRQTGCDGVLLTLLPEALNSPILAGLSFEQIVFTGGASDTAAVGAALAQQAQRCICNLDDPNLRDAVKQCGGAGLTYAERRGEADLNARNLRLCPDRIEFEALTNAAICRMRLPIPGGFGLYNALAALACGLQAGLTLETMSRILPHTRGVAGRMELVPTQAEYRVLIDSAATPEQVDNLLLATKGLAKGRQILVLGAPGDRDRKWRPLLGEAASQADEVILTADDPRTEPVEAICAQIQAGMSKPALVLPDRREAICKAMSLAQPGDLVILSGRGDKKEMLVQTDMIPLNEREIVAAYSECQKRKRKRMDA